MKTTTCYYLDSLRPIDVNPQLKQIIDAAMVLYAVKMGSDMRVKVNLVYNRCSTQREVPSVVIMSNFMKEIIHKGLDILIKNNAGGDKEEYTDAYFDAVREEWSGYAAQFIFR